MKIFICVLFLLPSNSLAFPNNLWGIAAHTQKPTITSLLPIGSLSTGGGTLTLTGTGFNQGFSITVDGVTCAGLSVKSTTLATCTIPANSAGNSTIEKVLVSIKNPASETVSKNFYYIGAPTLWLDATDPATMFTNNGCTTVAGNGASVRCLRSKVGSVDFQQSTSGNRPTLVSTTETYLSFDGTSDSLDSDGSYAQRTFFATAWLNSGFPAYTGLYADEANTDKRNIRIEADASPIHFRGNGLYNEDANDFTSDNGASSLRINGSVGNTVTTGAYFLLQAEAKTNFTSSGRISQSDFSRWWKGRLREILVYSSALTDSQRQSVEGFLACRAGLGTALPTDHPARNCP